MTKTWRQWKEAPAVPAVVFDQPLSCQTLRWPYNPKTDKKAGI